MSETLPDPRKRPRQARSVTTFEAILEAAARILESLGFADLTQMPWLNLLA